MKVTVECDYCGKKFKKKKSKVENTDHNFCCKEHFHKWQSDKHTVEVECDNCGKKFKRDKSKYEKYDHHFCCRECYREFTRGKHHPRYNSKIVECDYCGKEFEKEKGEIEKSEHNFCSPECYHKWDSEQGTVEVECATCGKKFKIPKCYKSKHNYCSRECYQNKPKEQHPTYQGKPLKELARCVVKSLRSQKLGLERRGTEGDSVVESAKQNGCQKTGKERTLQTGREKPLKESAKSVVKSSRFQRHGSEKKEIEVGFVARNVEVNGIVGENHPQWKGGTSFLPYPPDWKEKRRKALERDNYTCQKCGLTNKESLEKFGEELSVHHKNGDKFDSRLENLVTLCRSCHQAVENTIRAQT